MPNSFGARRYYLSRKRHNVRVPKIGFHTVITYHTRPLTIFDQQGIFGGSISPTILDQSEISGFVKQIVLKGAVSLQKRRKVRKYQTFSDPKSCPPYSTTHHTRPIWDFKIVSTILDWSSMVCDDCVNSTQYVSLESGKVTERYCAVFILAILQYINLSICPFGGKVL